MSRYVMAIDQGTTGSTVMILSETLEVVGKGYSEFPQIYPKPGWVEHDPEEIWNSVVVSIQKALLHAKLDGSAISAIGITNQRETVLLWDRATGKPVHNAIVWQCRRTAPICSELKAAGLEPMYREKTGLLLDPYFSGTKARWLLEQNEVWKTEAAAGSLCLGTIDSFLVWRLSGGQAHVTDVSNASRTLMMDIHKLEWSDELLKPLGVPRSILPEIRGNAEVYGQTVATGPLPAGIPIAGMAGDQQAALFGQACFKVGQAKCTYGTGAFLLVNTGSGSVFIAGAAVQWLRDELKIISTSPEVESLAASVPDSGGVVFVPALAGLGAPHWNAEARGLIWGLTRGSNQGHIAQDWPFPNDLPLHVGRCCVHDQRCSAGDVRRFGPTDCGPQSRWWCFGQQAVDAVPSRLATKSHRPTRDDRDDSSRSSVPRRFGGRDLVFY